MSDPDPTPTDTPEVPMTLYNLLSLFYAADHDRTPLTGLVALLALFAVLVML